jgi:hypothetical protein
MASTRLAYTSAATNRFSNASDVLAPSTIVFGLGKYVALWNAAVRDTRFIV